MGQGFEPGRYEAWYRTPRGRWIAEREFGLMMRLLQPELDRSLLDVGCGTGQFSRRFAAAGLRVTGLDPAPAMLHHARLLGGGMDYVEGSALALPFNDASFDYCAAVTSLCFVADPGRALAEMWRVARRGVVLGLLNRHSVLYRRKQGQGGYAGARWDSLAEVRRWCAALSPAPRLRAGTAIFLPAGGALARLAERLLPARLPWGGFLAVVLEKV
ncbi:class I SAM-dependent methyltransferase [Thiohalobacter sp. IOR34]|uniref:class I SAM-dependent methyltransferase n=1 Tax=Thiohalobacter sp. IOR34 TaxID=3057176 RepID=UPI0025B14748|nr:class I SAM-dependent methyltransferase [Thiohalobacter sp. IOR34]WJW76507.1 class I SAM-dependent methyltransferase [Thiohalobacter sp. IOR34]